MILTAKARVKLRLPGSALQCYTFGSPGVMGPHAGEGSARVCKLMGLDPSAIKCFCLDNDPVPRSMLAVDPAYSFLKQTQLGSRLLGWRESLWGGDGPLTSKRFLFEPVGRHFLIRWDPESGSRLVEIGEGSVKLEEGMKIEVEKIISDPMRLIKAMTDHRQGAYVAELVLAAREELKLADKRGRASQQQQQQRKEDEEEE